jgi:hypothetical protein
MTESAIFRLIVRAVGMILIGYGVADVGASALMSFGLPAARPELTGLHYATVAVGYLVPGLVILFAAPLITRIVYGSADNPN